MTRDFTKRSAGYGDLRTRPMARVARFFLAILALILGWALVPAEAAAQSRIKDIVDIEGVRDNMLVGYGLVVGLNGTGDSLDTAVFTRESLVGMLQRMGVNASDSDLDTDNIAAVMVTATLPPFSRQGSRVDVTVSSMGDADSLLGGTLLVTPMLGADGEIYAVSQGTVAVGGFSAQGAAETVVKAFQPLDGFPMGPLLNAKSRLSWPS